MRLWWRSSFEFLLDKYLSESDELRHNFYKIGQWFVLSIDVLSFTFACPITLQSNDRAQDLYGLDSKDPRPNCL